ncbi:hypothetical protein [Mycetocola zhujimingii]|uniref:Uncharacterized protein n=1 Tax=Mycetocola zhujimingii TaxID=2079792 RepID=A0A2U1TG90_9MICO|nr:hypothetical protein [Mycetocola zhujimingii]PWC07908.1 hypothetical protein DF223_00665 [Mycetocola zhujimingii]
MFFTKRPRREPALPKDEPAVLPGAQDLRRFVASRFMEPAVVRFGVEVGFLAVSDVVSVELARYGAGDIEAGSAEETIALLLSDDLERLASLLDVAVRESTPVSSPLDLWAYVGLARINAVWASFDDPWDAVETHLRSLGYPENYKHFLRYTEAEKGEPTGLPHMKRRLEAFLTRCQLQWGP